jgi:CheY-like chemotaxis protein
MSYREEPTVIVTDYFMPRGDAQYLLAKLRSLPATQDIPVIVMSGRDLGDATMQSLIGEFAGHPGAAHILRKSMDTSELFAALQEFCGFAS